MRSIQKINQLNPATAVKWLPALVGFLILVAPSNALAAKCANGDCLKTNPIVKDINSLINFLSIGVGIVVVIMIIVGGIRYTTADNPQAVSAAKQHIANALIALVAFLLTFAFLQWLIPGGIFG
jgi:hypothetical protein